ncbi:helix-turn-helix domain-containing protein [Gaoshiqia sp. Z1-71]|uniref:helix-turn-helix domain-containing protein n=1 Tax=Gaoshiqia hydrogeniformans TaxID=3290090 RepID=UPI003BF80386
MNIRKLLTERPEIAEKITVSLKGNDLLPLADLLAERIKPEPAVLQPAEKYRTADEVSDYLGVTRVTLWQWAKKGILKPLKIGNVLRYRQSDIDAAFSRSI